MERVLKAISEKKSKALQLWEQLVNIDSGVDNPAGIEQVAHIIGEELKKIGFRVSYIGYPDVATHILAHKQGSKNKNILLSGHMDTVFKKGTTAERPFTVKDGIAYGPGVLDMKGGITTAIIALEALYESGWNDKNVTVFFCGDEETGHLKTDAVNYFYREARGKDAVFNMESGRPDGNIVIGRKGGIKPWIKVFGRTAHAGNEPEKGANAILELVYKLVDIQKITDIEAGITINVGVIEGGVADNVVPGEASAKLDIRFAKVEQAEKILQDLREIAAKQYVPGTETTVSEDKIVFMPFEKTKAGLSLFQLVQDQGRKLCIPEIQGMVMGASSDACWTTMAGAPTVCSMGPRGGLNHSEREYVVVEGLIERAKLLALSIDAV